MVAHLVYIGLKVTLAQLKRRLLWEVSCGKDGLDDPQHCARMGVVG